MPGKRKDRPDPASPTYREDLAAFRKSGKRVRGYKAEARDGEVVLALIEHDGDRIKAAQALGITHRALQKRLERSKALVDRYEAVRDETARKAVETTRKKIIEKRRALEILSSIAEGEDLVTVITKSGDAAEVGPSHKNKIAAISQMAAMLPGWTQEQRQTITVELAERFMSLPADRRRELIATHGARAPEVWAQEVIDVEAEEAALELPSP